MTRYIGIDPGAKGAMALLDDDRVTIIPLDKDEYIAYLKAISESKQPCICVLERVSARPGQGVTSMFSFGTSYGWLMGVLDSFNIPYELITPQKWKKEFSVTGDKNSSIDVCKRLYPTVSLHRSERCRTDDDNMAEALLMATYAKRRL